ncbi:Acyltransferase easC [Aspergillus mulundensis]|uniref:Acyltransferase easC n=1 Tax=Aspergillus mulundensis TaxID=1810919 RepID=A0A3D8R014_9EURO|nr:Acyltransferase easC [Aspergillus mulundensis]RDW67403.1 Acyltransferase easC [Aspergillus mulundensis]
MEETKIKLSVPLSEDVIKLSALDQQIMRFYPKTLLIFEQDTSKDTSDIVHHLKSGLAVALSEYPDFATTVAPIPGSQRKDLELRISHDSGVPFKVVDQTKQDDWIYGSYSNLAAKHFPVSDIPHDTLFIPQPAPGADGLPATFLQVNLIEGGVIIAISWHHAVCDARGMGIFTDAWARHTQTSVTNGKLDLPATQAEGTRDRWRLDHGLRDATIEQLPEYTIDSSARDDGSGSFLLDRENPITAPYAVSTWYLSANSLKSLREALAQTESKTQFTKVEAVSALVWKHLSIARQLDQVYPDGTSLFTTRLDFRARTKPPFPDTFVGNINEPTARVRMPIAEICSAPTPGSLTTLAEAVRAATENTTEQSLRTLIGLVNDAPAVTDVAWNYNYFPGPDLGVTDISNIEAMKQSWGSGLGSPKCIRSYSRETGLLYLLPLDQEGGFEIQVQCEREALERLRGDEGFGRYCEYRRVSVYNG